MKPIWTKSNWINKTRIVAVICDEIAFELQKAKVVLLYLWIDLAFDGFGFRREKISTRDNSDWIEISISMFFLLCITKNKNDEKYFRIGLHFLITTLHTFIFRTVNISQHVPSFSSVITEQTCKKTGWIDAIVEKFILFYFWCLNKTHCFWWVNSILFQYSIRHCLFLLCFVDLR